MSLSDTQHAPPASTIGNNAIDLTRLEPWLEANIRGFSGPVTLEKFAGGQSNPTYRLWNREGQPIATGMQSVAIVV